MKNNTIIGLVLTPIVCIFTTQIMSMRQEKIDRDFQESLDKYAKSSIRESDSITSVRETEDTTIDYSHKKAVFPTKDEIMAINAKLPVLVADGLMLTDVKYDDKTMVQTFTYDYTHEIDECLITKGNINQRKINMVKALKGTDSEDVLNAGVVYFYVYRSVDKKILYVIQISAIDLK